MHPAPGLSSNVVRRTIELVAETSQHTVSESSEEDASVFVISESMYAAQDEAVLSASGSASVASASVDGEYGLKQLQPEIDVAGGNGQSVSADYTLTSQDTADGVHAGSNGAVEERQTLEGMKL